MRQAVKTVPMDGKFIILEDDASGTREVARWSTEASGWVGEDGAPSKITPTYWHPLSQEDHGSGLSPAGWFPSEKSRAQMERILIKSAEVDAQVALIEANRGPRARRLLAVSSMVAILVAAALLGVLFRVELAAYATLYLAKIDAIRRNAIERIVNHESTSPSLESQSAESSVQNQELLHRLGEFPLDGAQTHAQLTRAAEQTRKALEREREKTASARARDEIEAHAALSSKTGVEAAQVKQAAESATAELRQSLQQERHRTEALSRELATARDEIEAHAALSSKTGAEAAQVKQAAESATAELRQSLQQERDRTEALSPRTGHGARRNRGACGVVEQDGRRSRSGQAGRGERHGGAATIVAAGARLELRR